MDLDAVDRADLIDALQDAYDDLQYRLDNNRTDYTDEDLPAIEAKLIRWTILSRRLGPDWIG